MGGIIRAQLFTVSLISCQCQRFGGEDELFTVWFQASAIVLVANSFKNMVGMIHVFAKRALASVQVKSNSCMYKLWSLRGQALLHWCQHQYPQVVRFFSFFPKKTTRKRWMEKSKK